MSIDLNKVLLIDDMDLHIDQDITFDQDTYFLPEIKRIESCHFVGDLKSNLNNEVILNGNLDADIILEDSISLDERKYKISTEVVENIDELVNFEENTIDIIDVLWQNIVLEVPSRYTEVTDYSKYQGDGWRLISEEDLVVSKSPFAILKDKE